MKNEWKILVIAESDARFDGYPDGLSHLSRINRDRYIARATRSYYALQSEVAKRLSAKLQEEINRDYAEY